MKDVADTLGKRSWRAMQVFLIATIVFNLLILAAMSSLWWSSRNTEFQPFRFPEQQVLNRLPGKGDVPAAHVGDDIIVRGTKCNTSDQTFDVTAVVSWASVDPPGSLFSFSAPGGPTAPGCVTRTFVNHVPDTTVDQMENLLLTRPYVVWQFRGAQTAVAKNGATRVWSTEPFYIYPKKETP